MRRLVNGLFSSVADAEMLTGTFNFENDPSSDTSDESPSNTTTPSDKNSQQKV